MMKNTENPFVVPYAAFIAIAIVSSFLPGSHLLAQPWQASNEFPETSYAATIESNIRIHVNAPRDAEGKPVRATRLIVFALPNGNTLEQTLGCQMKPGMDWHYDIQHIAAQTRLLRELFPKESILLVCAEAPGLSWPTFRRTVPNANAIIGKLVNAWRLQFGEKTTQVTLTGHSGGGSFMTGLIESAERIPAYIDRIAYLDANYSFDAAMHAKKLEDWLRGGKDRRYILVCYDDREIMLNGKKVVGPDGGTFRATNRTRDALGKTFKLTESDHEPFHETVGLDGRIHFYIHPNPENIILHTVLVGEMNGLLQIETLGTAQEGRWGTFGGPRAYTKYIQAEPSTTPTTGQGAASATAKPSAVVATKKQLESVHYKFPPRPGDAIGGAAFAKHVEAMKLPEREAAILHEISTGNFPEFLRTFKRVEIRGPFPSAGATSDVSATIDVMPDYLAIGSEDDFVRMPMTPQTAQAIADRLECVLPTRKLVDAIDAQAERLLTPRPMTEAREAVATFVEHNRLIETQRGGQPLGLLVAGIKKDIVLTPRIFEKPRRLAIYGWRQPNGQPIQPLTIVHWNGYVDYSHGARLIHAELVVNGQKVRIDKLLADSERSALISDEGPMNPPRYPAE
ncbi:MAG: hypothetical protein IT425_04910 [Pirellulales bacterium]|nr:hypothetical protein [Pirellulales bacterium]